MATKVTVPIDTRAYFKAPGPLGGNDSPAYYEIGNLKSRLAKSRSLSIL